MIALDDLLEGKTPGWGYTCKLCHHEISPSAYLDDLVNHYAECEPSMYNLMMMVGELRYSDQGKKIVFRYNKLLDRNRWAWT